MTVLEALVESPLSMWVLLSPWGYYSLLAIHGIGMAAVVGSIFMLCLRVLGYSRGVIVSDLGRLRWVAWGGFIANAVSGAILFASNGVRLIQNLQFQIKIISIVLGGMALWALWRLINRTGGKDDPNFSFGVAAKAAAVATLAFWTIAIIFGRDIAYNLDPIL